MAFLAARLGCCRVRWHTADCAIIFHTHITAAQLVGADWKKQTMSEDSKSEMTNPEVPPAYTGALEEKPLGSIVSLGGGHGLFQTLRAVRQIPSEKITAVVTVADDGGSSGRIRRELGHVPPGDLRMALAALTPRDEDGKMWEAVLQHRFGGHGALAGHAAGNLLIAGLYEVLKDEVKALDVVAKLVQAEGRVLPVCDDPLDIAADVAGLDSDPRIMREVRGQVAVASTIGQVRRVKLYPENPKPCREVIEAINEADLITLGPGSWFSSVIPHLLVPGVVDAINASEGFKVVILNLTAEPGETSGFSAERHIHMLSQHAQGLKVNLILADSYAMPNQSDRQYLERAAMLLGATVAFHDLRQDDGKGLLTDRHDPAKLATALAYECQKARRIQL